ncbi:hypothetical protein [Aeromicrobium sp.]|uniref:hypothetical protein n=1 Tax=Aeromicrobium sp. TaxID=1871063 RepID=UPI003C695DBB
MDWLWVLITVARSASPAPADHWASTLAVLDHDRAAAFARADAELLDRVYVRGSQARAADAATIADHRRRGARIVGAELRILSCRVLSVSGSRVRLDVVDRLASTQVIWTDGSTTALPQDEPSRRIVTLASTAAGWRVTEVSPRPRSRR